MPSWSDLQNKFAGIADNAAKGVWLTAETQKQVKRVADLTGSNVLCYGSAFLQKPEIPGLYLQINREDINGFMSAMFGMDFNRGVVLLLHTPGGQAEAAETIVDYLWSKFPEVRVIVPTYAMSAGTMIALAAGSIVMGRQSQLGPIDPQLNIGGRVFSAHSIVSQFDEAKGEIVKNPILAHAWAPVLQHYGPALLQEARKALGYGQGMVTKWLAARTFAKEPNPLARADAAAKYFNDHSHGSHGKRIGRDEARAQGLNVTDLEASKDLQDAVLTLYHCMTIGFENGPAAKVLFSSTGRTWLKNIQIQVAGPPAPQPKKA